MVIFSIAGAPYRDAFYLHLARQAGGEVIYAKVLDKAPDHAWSPDEREHPRNFHEKILPAVSLKGSGWFQRWRQGRNPLVFPTPATWRTLDEWDPDLLLIQEYSPISLALLLWAKVHGRKIFVMTEIGRATGGVGFLTRIRHSIFGRFVDGQLAHTLAACEPIAPGLTNVCFSPHAVEIAGTLPEKAGHDGRLRLLFVGNMIERKGVDLLLAAANRLREQGYGGRFVVRLVGGGDTAWLRQELDALGADVELAGFKEKEDLQAEYRAADVFVLPSRFDTFGVVSHEAAAQGLALVLSRHAGSSELFGEREKAAEIVVPEDGQSLAAALARLIDSPTLSQERGRAARLAAVKWSVQSNARRCADWLFAKETDPREDLREP